MPFGSVTTKGRRFPVEVLTSEEVRRILGETSRRGVCGTRDRALIAVMYRGGLRVSEALDLEPKDVDLAAGTVAVLHGKGDRSRVVGVDSETVALLETWLTRRATLGIGGRSTIFCTLSGARMSDVQIRQHLKELGRRAGVEKRVHPHGLRHSRAVDLVQHGTPVPVIQRALGHSSLATTNTYLNHVAPADVIAAMQEGAW